MRGNTSIDLLSSNGTNAKLTITRDVQDTIAVTITSGGGRSVINVDRRSLLLAIEFLDNSVPVGSDAG